MLNVTGQMDRSGRALNGSALVVCFAVLLTAPAFAATSISPDLGADITASTSPGDRPRFTAEPVYRELNVLGTWAISCDGPASPSNPHVSTTAPGGGLIVETHDVGADFTPNLYHVVAARKLGKDQIEAQVLFRPGTEAEEEQTIVLRITPAKKGKGVDTRRTMFNRGEEGDVRVKDGVGVVSRLKTPVLKRCS